MYGKPADPNDDSAGRLYEMAERQAGFLSVFQTESAGMSRSTLSYHASGGRAFERVSRGIYRLRKFPTSPHSHLIIKWLAVQRPDAVISHRSALEFFMLKKPDPESVEITIPRTPDAPRNPAGVRFHFREAPMTVRDRRLLVGIPVTRFERTIADLVLETGWTDQIDLTVRDAIQRQIVTPKRLQDKLAAMWGKQLDVAIARATGDAEAQK